MAEQVRRRRSSFFPKPVEEPSEKQLELFCNMDWVNDEKDKIISSSLLFGGPAKKTVQQYTKNLKDRKEEYLKLIYNKQEEHIRLKELLRKNKLELDWKTVCEGLTDFERDFVNNRPDYKCLAENVQLLTFHMALVKRTNYELHTTLNAYNKCVNEEILKLQECIVEKIVEDDSGVGSSYCYDSDTNSVTMKSFKDEDSNDIIQE